MPIDSTVDPKRALVVTTCWGVVTAPELLDHATALAQAPDLRRDMRQLVDVRAVTQPCLNWKDIRALAFISLFSRESRRAIVVSGDEAYGLARMFQLAANRDDENMQVFRDYAQARRWLGIDGPDCARVPDADTEPPPIRLRA